MKKYVAFLLSFVMILSLFSCNLPGDKFDTTTTTASKETTTEPQQTTSQSGETTTEPEGTTTDPQGTSDLENQDPPQDEESSSPKLELESNVFTSYEEIVEVYRLAVERFDLINDYSTVVAQKMGFDNVLQAEWFRAILGSAFLFYPGDEKGANVSTPEKLSYFQYAEKDLNGDGIEELVLLTKRYDVLAIFSKVDNEPVLLGRYMPRGSCWIDSEGRIHLNGSGGALCFVHRISEVADGGRGLHMLAEYGMDDVWFPETYLFKDVNGVKVSITKEEYEALDAQYGEYLGSQAGAEETRRQAGFNCVPLFSDDEITRATYLPAINGDVPVYFPETEEYFSLKNYVPSGIGVPLSECEDLKCAFIDFDNNTVTDFEMVIDCGTLIMLQYVDGKVIGRSTLTFEESQMAKSGVYFPFVAPWRKDNITPEEIKESMSLYWGFSDGWIEGACGTELVHRILVSDEVDENGYYLVTWQIESYVSACDCPDCEAGLPKNIRVHRRVLVHAKTGEMIEATVTPQEAKQLASEYWGIEDGYVDYGLGTTYVMRIVIAEKPEIIYDGTYYHVIWQIEYYSHEGYKNGAEPNHISDYIHLCVHTQTGEYRTYPGYVDGK